MSLTMRKWKKGKCKISIQKDRQYVYDELVRIYCMRIDWLDQWTCCVVTLVFYVFCCWNYWIALKAKRRNKNNNKNNTNNNNKFPRHLSTILTNETYQYLIRTWSELFHIVEASAAQTMHILLSIETFKWQFKDNFVFNIFLLLFQLYINIRKAKADEWW